MRKSVPMRVEWQRVPRKLGIPFWGGLLIGLWLTLVASVVAMEQATGNEVVVCWFRALTGVACPTCGSTRALLALAKGRVLESFAHNPLVVLAGILGAAWLAARVGLGRRLTVMFGVRGRRIAWLLAAALFFANWAYVIVWHVWQANEALK